LANHSLITTLKNLRGNARGCVFTEPLWGIPFNLYAPYTSVYMLALGLTDSKIGLITTIGLVFQIFWTMLSGAITDKLGRKRTTLIFDLVSWSLPCLIWAIAQDFSYFLVAAIVNSMWRVVHTSWQCLLVEDTDPDLLVDVWSLISMGGLLAAFVAPIAGLLVDQFSLVPTVRGLYLFAFVMMGIKALATNSMVTETQQGIVRMQETKDQPLFAVLREYPDVLKQILRTPGTLVIAGLILVVGIYRMISRTFWSILVTESIQIPPEHLALFAFARSVTMLVFFFVAMPRLRTMDARKPMIVGFLGMIASHVLLISVPTQNYWLLLLATVLEACSVPVATTLLEKVVVISIDAKERARIMSILYVLVMVFTSPFGWIVGRISEINRSLPFVLNIVLFGVGILLVYLTVRIKGYVTTKESVEEAVRA
jgi:DHA1 family tetracycline resistance protein-like MFS transporter